MKYLIQLITLFALVFTVNTALARGGHNPPPAPEPNLMNVITVSAENGDYTNPVEALNSIPDTNVDQYLIIVGPGVYEVSSAIHMKEGVTIQGAGQESTIITGDVSTSFANEFSAIVKGANNSALTDLTIINRGGGTYSIAIFNSRASPRIERVTAIAMGEGGYANTGVLNENYSSPIMTNVTASASSEGATTETFGVYNVIGSSPTMVNVKSNASGGSWRNSSVYIADSSPFIVESVLDGSPGLMLDFDSSGSRIVNNKIIGGVYGALLSVTPTSGSVCRGNYDENLTNVDCPTP